LRLGIDKNKDCKIIIMVGRHLENQQNLSGRDITERQDERYQSLHRGEDKRDRYKCVRKCLEGKNQRQAI
jgi:hypothetical protein